MPVLLMGLFVSYYADLERRVMDINEKDFLRERGVVTEEQVTLGKEKDTKGRRLLYNKWD